MPGRDISALDTQGLVMTPPTNLTEERFAYYFRQALSLLGNVMRGHKRRRKDPFVADKAQIQTAIEILRAYSVMHAKLKTEQVSKRGTVNIKNAVINPGKGVIAHGEEPAGSINAMTNSSHPNMTNATPSNTSENKRKRVVEGSAKEIYEAVKRGA